MPDSPRRRRLTSLTTALVLLLLGLPAAVAEAAAPVINNTGTGCAGQTAWLVSCATMGETDQNGNFLRISALVSHDGDKTIPSLLTDDDWDGTVDPTTVRSASQTTRPGIATGYPRSRVNLNYQIPTSNTGMSCGPFSFTRRTDNRNSRIRPRDSATQDGGTTSSIIKFTAQGQCLGAEDFAYIYRWDGMGSNGSCASPSGVNNNFNQQTTPGTSLTFCYTGDDPDVSGNSDFTGVNWRLRNLRTGTVGGTQISCPGGGDNGIKPLQVNFPDRGAYVVEAELRDGSGCTQNQNPGYWFPIGTADVNGAAIPQPGLTATRPQTNGITTITLDPEDDPDSGDGGGVQIVQWDLNGNGGDGVSGFETDTVAGLGATITANQTKTINTTGMSPGVYTVRARVIDNGAMDAADAIRRTSSTATTTFRVNSPPSATGQSVSAESGKPVGITLTGSDPDPEDNPLSYTVVDAPDNGTLTGSGADRTYTPSASFAGTDTLTFRVADGFGGTATATVTFTVRPDTQILTGPSPTADNGPTGSFTFESQVSGVGFECNLDDAGFGDCTSAGRFEYQNLSDGEHTFAVRAKTGGGLTDPTPAARTFQVDAVLPQTEIDAPRPPAIGNNSTVTLRYSADENATFRCRLDAGAEEACPSSDANSGSRTYANLPDGSHTFTVFAVDAVGNRDASAASYTFVIDTADPETSIDDGPAAETTDRSPNFEFSSPTEAAPFDAAKTFECKLVGPDQTEDFDDCATGKGYTDLRDGSYTFSVRALDAAGNLDESPATRAFRVDTLGPETEILSGPPERPALTNDPDATFTFSADDPDVDDAGLTLECRLDADVWRPCTSPETYADLADGEYTFAVRGVDRLGNADGSPAARIFIVDATETVTQIDSGPSAPTQPRTAKFEFSAAAPASTFECELDNGGFEACDPATGKEYTDVPEGRHVFRVRATDPAGNLDSTPAARSWRVDLTDPETSVLDGPRASTNDRSAKFGFGSSETGSTFECRLDAPDTTGETFELCESTKTYPGLADGPHTFSVRSTDIAGNADESAADYRFTVDTASPLTTITDGPPARTAATTVTFSFASENGAAFQCRLARGSATPAWKSCVSGRSFSGLSDGGYEFQVRARDTAGNLEAPPRARSFVVDATRPQTRLLSGPAGVRTSRNATFAFAASEEDSTFECRVDNAAFGPCDSPLEISGLSDGTHTFQVRASDALGNLDRSPATRRWTIDATAPNTVIDSGPSGATTSTDASFTFSSPDGGEIFECQLDGGRFTECVSPKSYKGLELGRHTFAVRASDAAGNTDPSVATRTFTVQRAAAGDPDDGPGTDPGADPGADPDPDPDPTRACSVAVRTPGCGRPSLTSKAKRRKNGNGTDLALVARSGGAEMGQTLFELSQKTMVEFTDRAEGETAGRLRLLSSSGKTVRVLELRLPEGAGQAKRGQARRAARATAVLASRGGTKVTINEGFGPRVSVTGLPAGVTSVALDLRGAGTCLYRSRAACSAQRAAARLTDRGGAKARVTAKTTGACRRGGAAVASGTNSTYIPELRGDRSRGRRGK